MRRTPWHRRIVTQAMALQLTVIAVVLVVVSIAFARTGQDALEEQYGLRAQAVAESVAEIPDVRKLVAADVISPDVQQIAEAVRLRTDVDFVVITNADGIRHSHPNSERIGHMVSTDPGPALSGVSDWYVQTGTLGRSVRGKVPIWDTTGEAVVGIVSVGVLTGEVAQTLRNRLSGLLLAAGGAFAAGAVAAYLGARRIRRQTLGLEPPEIAALYEHRDGLLRALHEGVLAVDRAGYVTLVNDEAAAMLGLRDESAGESLRESEGLEPLLELVESETAQVDVPLQIGAQTLLVTCAPITIRNRREGAVFTFRDRTELQGLVSELESAQGLVEALRAQAHEHSNDLHTISGLIELGRHEEVLSVVSDHSAAQRELADLYDDRGGADSLIVASLLAKAAVAGERDVRLRTHLGELPKTEIHLSRDLVTVIGNLVDNAVDHLSQTTVAGGEVEIAIWYQNDAIRIDVSDSGDGIEPADLEAIFERGYTTKDVRSHDGLGLALVSDVVRAHGGSISVDSELGSGTLFSVEVPVTRTAGLVDA
ncbi:MAG: sensor histidine kinase [Acidimicrobiia bacterium]|nr:sensor histidine kinase [Acidimicrobiia bacterium]